MPDKLRSVIKEHRFEEDLRRIYDDARRADEFIEGVETILARKPEAGIQVADNSPVWCVLSNAHHELSPFIVFYTFNENYVYLLSVRLTEFLTDE